MERIAFLGSAGEPFLRPGLHDFGAPCAAAVKGAQQRPQGALDGREHGVTLDLAGFPALGAILPGGCNLASRRPARPCSSAGTLNWFLPEAGVRPGRGRQAAIGLIKTMGRRLMDECWRSLVKRA